MEKQNLDEFKNRVKQVVKGLSLDRAKNKISVIKEYDNVFSMLANTNESMTDKQVHKNLTSLFCSLGVIIKTMNNKEIGEYARVKIVSVIDEYQKKMNLSMNKIDISKDLYGFFIFFNKTIINGFEHQRELKKSLKKMIDLLGDDEQLIDGFFEKLFESIDTYVKEPDSQEDYRKIVFIAKLVDSYEDKTIEMLSIEKYIAAEILGEFKKLAGKYSSAELIAYVAKINKLLPKSLELMIKKSLPDSWITALSREVSVKMTEAIRQKVGEVNVNGVLIKNKKVNSSQNEITVILEKIYNERISIASLLNILGSSPLAVTNQVLEYLEESDQKTVKKVLFKKNKKVLKRGELL